jgi:two-component system sensor histidine kinase UhpB
MPGPTVSEGVALRSLRFHYRRALRVPLFLKILLANSAIVALGAIAGTVITVWQTRRSARQAQYGLIALFGSAGIVISFIVNNWVLKRALAPLDRLQDAVDEVRGGNTEVRVTTGDTSDDRFDRLADTFNRMLDIQEQNAADLHQLSRRLIRAQEDERHRLARDLHDEAAQALTSLLVHLRLLERAKSPEEAQDRLQELRQLTAQALDDVRRVALDLRPTILDDLGLGPALEWRVDELNSQGDVAAEISIAGCEERLPRDLELVLYRVGQESLSNVRRHAEATHVSVSLRRDLDAVTMEIADDGVGFDTKANTGKRYQGMGLVGMRERLGMVGGQLIIESAPGAGTRVVATVQVDGDGENEV